MIELTYLAIFGIAMAAMFFGYGFGLFEGRSKGYKKRQKEEQKEKEKQPPPEPEKVTVTETVTVTVDDPGLLRIKSEGGTYTLDLDGTRVDPSTLPQEQRRRLIEILGVIRPWLEGRPTPPPTPMSAPTLGPASAPMSAPSGITPVHQSSLLDRIQSQPASSTPPAQTPPMSAAQAAPPSPQPVPSKPAMIAKEDRPIAPAGSMVEQIDSILQARLAGTPLEERGIFLTQSPEGGVNVYIGLTRYSGIDEVLDPDIKAVIRAAITEWEHKFTPGLK
jgi:hypothetical protein